MQNNSWARLLAYVTGLVNQRLLLQCEYLIAENRILRSHVSGRLRLSDAERSSSPWRNPRNFRGDSSRIVDADRLRCDRLTFVGRAEGCH